LIKLITFLQRVHYISDLPAWVEVILSRPAAMESQQPQIQLQLSTILQKIDDGVGLVVDKMPDGIMLPLETFDDVDNFEIQVASENTFKQLVCLRLQDFHLNNETF